MWQTIFPVEIKGNYWELSVLGPGAPVALARAHTHTHTEIETLAKRDRGTNKKAEESCFSPPTLWEIKMKKIDIATEGERH